ncbi:CAP domain-containing protein [Demequina sp. B12]|uniref:CAP domain-containing protein n=1 Tax=Demequina sp. B12 TaxID=2992757 RepID=UPI00237C2E7D|nr:CAP domain-containing protein [Demequina sp. B12]MDE0573641.1 CAP domain-containing protein [Demequina sp. B12]
MSRPGRIAVTGVIGVTLILAACQSGGTPRPATTPAESRDTAAYALEVFDAVNTERKAGSLEALTWDECLKDAAAPRAATAAGADDLQHEALLVGCGDGARTGENLSRLDATPAEVVERWMESAGHRANILDEGFTVGAVSCVAATAIVTCSFLAQEPR